MCLGDQARHANKVAMRQYQYQLDKREREWMQTLSLTRAEQVQHEQLVDASNLGLANVYSQIQEQQGEMIDQAMVARQEDWKNFLENSKFAEMKASGRALGRSTNRIGALELGQYLKRGNDVANQLTKATYKLQQQGAQAKARTRAQQLESFTKVAWEKHPDIAPPKPVLQNVGNAMFMDALKIGTSIAGLGTGLGEGGFDIL